MTAEALRPGMPATPVPGVTRTDHPAPAGIDGDGIDGDPGDPRVHAAARDAGLPDRLAHRVAALVPAIRPPAAAADAEGRRPVLVACDLDRTLVYSAAALGLTADDAAAPRLAVAEVYRGAPLSFWTRDAETLLVALARVATVVPATTRTRAQFARIQLPPTAAGVAVTTNGGHLLVDGAACPDWSRTVADRLASTCAPLGDVVDHLARVTAGAAWLRSSRVAEDLFAYLVVDRAEMPASFLADLTSWCDGVGWTVSLQGRKVYCVPRGLTKSAAVAEVADRYGLTMTLAAGDSLLDGELLAVADAAVRPAHGELHDTGWRRPHVTVTERSGVLGGEELVGRLLATVLAG